MRFARAARLTAAALLCLLSGCSLLTGEQNIPPPWDSNAAPAEPVLPPGQNHFAPSPSFLKLDGAIGNPTSYPVPRPDPVASAFPVDAPAQTEPSPPADPSTEMPLPVAAAPPPAPAPPEMVPQSAPVSSPAAALMPAPVTVTDAVVAAPLPMNEAPAVPPPAAPPAPTFAPPVIDPVEVATVGTPVAVDSVPAARPAPPLVAESHMAVPPMAPIAEPAPVRVVASAGVPVPSPAPAAAPPTLPDGFVVGPGDLVTITVFGRPELTVNANVSDDGQVPMALIGNVRIGGLSPVQASDRIAAALRDGKYLIDPKVSVVFNEYRSRQISVLGEVKSPGRFPVNTRLTVLDAIALAGGIDALGSQSALILRPQGKIVTRYEVDIDELLDAGVGQEYFDVQGGDTVIVPRAEVFYIYGEVKQPNMYKLRPGMTVVQALSLGGGLTDKGSDRRVEIRRRGPDGKLLKNSATLSDIVEPDDVVYVHERIF